MSIGSQIAIRRRQMGLTQQALAEKLDVSFQAVSSWERDEYLPETEKLKKLAAALNTTVSFLMGEDPEHYTQWELHDAMFSVDNMLLRVRMYAQARKMKETQKALRIMLKYHEGAVRKSKNGEVVPYVIHPLMMACHAFALGIGSDDLIATALLHDVVENSEITVEDLEVNEEIKEAVRLLTYEEEHPEDEIATQNYYERISGNKLASIVKLLDRCSNVSTMVTGFSSTKMAGYILETEEYVFPILEKVKHEYDEYYDATFLLKYQFLSVMETLRRFI